MNRIPPLFALSPLPEGFEAIFTDAATYREESTKVFREVFRVGGRAPAFERSPERESRAKRLRAEFFSGRHEVRILVLRSGQVVGWLSGEMLDQESFYLRNSGFVPDARRKGLYSSLHADLLVYLRAQGFERLVSDHSPNNKAVLLLKLRLGYVVNALTLDDRFGPLVRLVYFLNRDRLEKFCERYELELGE